MRERNTYSDQRGKRIEIMSEIIEKIMKRRIELGLTQVEVAERLGVPQAAVSRLEKQKHSPSIDMVEKYAEAVGCKIDIVSK